MAPSTSELGENDLIENNASLPKEIKGLAHGLGHLRIARATHLLPVPEQVTAYAGNLHSLCGFILTSESET